MEKVYILQHEITNLLKDLVASDIIGVSLDFARATEMFNAYLSALEDGWRKSEEAGPTNTFNRFSEVVDNYLMSASLARTRDDNHTVFLVFFEAE
jgi:hypothetical protein